MTAHALISYIPNHLVRILQDNSSTERSNFKNFALFVAECLFNASEVLLMFINYQVTLKIHQKLV